MKRPVKALALLTAAALSATLLGACSSRPQEDPADQVTLGRSIFLDESGVAFWGCGPFLCTGLIDEEGHIFDPVIEGQTTGNIYGLAVYDKDLYLAGEDGLFRYDLEIFQGEGTTDPMLLTGDSIDDGFEIFRETVYYTYGTTLYSLPITGGEETRLATDVDSFTLTPEGICYASQLGGLYLLSFDGALQERIAETEEDCRFCLTGDTIFYRCVGSDQICEVSLDGGPVTVVDKPRSLSEYSHLWANDSYLVYEDNHYERFAFLRDGSGEISLGKDGVLAGRGEGFFAGDILYTCTPYTGELREYHLTTGQVVQLDTKEVLKEALQAQTDASSGASPAVPDGYDILSGFQIQEGDNGLSWILTEHILLSIPTQYATQVEQYDAATFGILYTPAWAEGFGGQLVTIGAYPVGDTSYQEAPSWTLAGRADGMQYVAFFPTDVQYDTGDETQTREYNALLDHLRQIGSPNAPFQWGAIGQGGP